ncbi:hypothetical protein ACPOL_0183 [Acidisarcina polymorpha]|uniref:Yip1 domain-containing protein n=1 Tax=Acidisarcina polymorpha TaxID=2211140 RepID=A0A2Z5FS39_9BACT|nr:YIP1 family protein [Acidisarcina polymorpha]AXC09568.1 hypothetical protein ACPOL_0183 [Acidisarcina polymorpha]
MTEIGTPATAAAGEGLSTRPLSQGDRVIDTFIAPTKTFTDILRDQSWWFPFLIMLVIGYGFVFAVEKRVGWDQVLENALKTNTSQADQINNAPVEQRPVVRSRMVASYRYISYAFPVFVLFYWVLASAVLLGTLNFGFGGQAKYRQIFAVFVYAGLPGSIKSVLSIIVLYAGLSGESFQLQNPVGTNLGYYLPTDSPKWLLSLGSSLDVFTIWTVVLLIIGSSIVAKVKRGSAAVAVVGWWILLTMVSVGFAAFQG